MNNRLCTYILLAGSAIVPPAVSEITGFSESFGNKGIYRIEADLSRHDPSSGGGSEADVERNLGYIEDNRDVMRYSARLGFDAIAGLAGFSGMCGIVILKRKLCQPDSDI